MELLVICMSPPWSWRGEGHTLDQAPQRRDDGRGVTGAVVIALRAPVRVGPRRPASGPPRSSATLAGSVPEALVGRVVRDAAVVERDGEAERVEPAALERQTGAAPECVAGDGRVLQVELDGRLAEDDAVEDPPALGTAGRRGGGAAVVLDPI